MKARQVFSLVIVLLLTVFSCSDDGETLIPEPLVTDTFVIPRSETFTFSSNGIDVKGKIYLPDSYETNNALPAVYLLDYQEGGNYLVVKDEYIEVLQGLQKISGFDALVVTLDAHLDVDSLPENFGEHYELFKNMTKYVDDNYTNSTSRTFIGRGREAGVVLLTLLTEDQDSSVFSNFIATDPPYYFMDPATDLIKNSNVPGYQEEMKLHFSFSQTNSRARCQELINSFNEAKYEWLTFESVEYPMTFTTAYRTTFAEGLKFVFEE